MKSKKIIWQTLGFMAPFILMSIADYSIPMFIDLTIRTSVLFYIHGAINQLIALCIGAFTFIVWRTSNPHTLASPTFPTKKAINNDLTATQQVASPKSASQTSLNPDIMRNQR